MKQILVLAQTYEPFKDGVAEAAKVMACGLAARGYQVTVGTGYHPDRKLGMVGANPAVTQFKVIGSASWRQGFHGEVAEYREFVANFRGEFIICHAWQAWTTDLAMPQFRNIKARTIMVSHGSDVHMIHWHGRFPWGLGQWAGWLPYTLRLPHLLKTFSRVVFLSHHVDLLKFFDHWLARRLQHPGIAIIPNTTDVEKFKQPLPAFRQKYCIGSGPVFLCVANYFDNKNQGLAVRAFRKARLKGATLVFIGSEFNAYQSNVQKMDQELAQSYPEGHVIFLQKISRELTLAAFRDCDVVVLTSKRETQPIVLIEAMACGKPFISTESSGCIRELVGGLVVDSEHEVSRQMSWLAENHNVRHALGQAGQKTFFAHYSYKRVVDAFEELLR